MGAHTMVVSGALLDERNKAAFHQRGFARRMCTKRTMCKLLSGMPALISVEWLRRQVMSARTCRVQDLMVAAPKATMRRRDGGANRAKRTK